MQICANSTNDTLTAQELARSESRRMGKGESGKLQDKADRGPDGEDHHTRCSAKRQQSKTNAPTILNGIYIKQKQNDLKKINARNYLL